MYVHNDDITYFDSFGVEHIPKEIKKLLITLCPLRRKIKWSTSISNNQQFRLNKVNEIKHYFIDDIRERELMSKNISKCIASFEYLGKSLIVLSVATGSISTASFATAIGAPVGIMSATCTLVFSVTTGFVKKFLKNGKK